jgi:hypothetical protein
VNECLIIFRQLQCVWAGDHPVQVPEPLLAQRLPPLRHVCYDELGMYSILVQLYNCTQRCPKLRFLKFYHVLVTDAYPLSLHYPAEVF